MNGRKGATQRQNIGAIGYSLSDHGIRWVIRQVVVSDLIDMESAVDGGLQRKSKPVWCRQFPSQRGMRLTDAADEATFYAATKVISDIGENGVDLLKRRRRK